MSERQITICGPEMAYQDKDGKDVPFFADEEALAELLAAEVLFCNTGKFGKDDTVVLFVACNDLFYWGSADAEHFTTADIEPLWRAWKSGDYGVEKWCCQHRGMRPQYVVEQSMRKADVWDAAMESLPSRETDHFGNPKIEP
jgi:hypothetical protein